MRAPDFAAMLALTIASSLLLGGVAAAGAAPYAPTDDQQVIQTLPTVLGGNEGRRAERARAAELRRQPGNLPLALNAARAAIHRARLNGDPRELGQAQAALAPWWPQSAPPPAVRLLRATIRQSQHDFAAALDDLNALVPATPVPALPATASAAIPLAVRAQAELTRASVLQVLGRLDEARTGCQRLATDPAYAALGAAARLPAQACLAELASLGGDNAQASSALAQLARSSAPDDSAWLALLRAELAERRGRPEAEALYREATADQPGAYALAARADWLLEQHREREVLALLAGREDADALLLRLAIAGQRLNDPAAAHNIAQLQARFDAARARGDNTHGREQSRFALALRGDTATALSLAQANWAVQKEPADALTLLRAAEAAHLPAAAQPVLSWARAHGFRDARWPRQFLERAKEPT